LRCAPQGIPGTPRGARDGWHIPPAAPSGNLQPQGQVAPEGSDLPETLVIGIHAMLADITSRKGEHLPEGENGLVRSVALLPNRVIC